MLVRRKKSPERMQPRIVADLEDRAVDLVEVHELVAHVVRAVDHRAQLEHLEAPPVHADALLREERGSARDADDRERRQNDDRSRQHQKQNPNNDVDAPLDSRPRFGNVALARYADGDLHRVHPSSARFTVAPTKSRPSISPSSRPGAGPRCTNGTYSRV